MTSKKLLVDVPKRFARNSNFDVQHLLFRVDGQCDQRLLFTD